MIVAALLSPALAWSQERLDTVAVSSVAECADIALESDFVRELRLRLPAATFLLGAGVGQAAWHVVWQVADGECVIEVTGLETATVAIPREPSRGDLELAASQVAWIITMAKVPVEPTPSAETELENKLEPEPKDVPTTVAPDPPTPQELAKDSELGGQAPGEASPTRVQTVGTPPSDQGIPVVMVASFVPSLSLPRLGARDVPRIALDFIAPNYYGIRGVEVAVVAGHAGYVNGVQASGLLNIAGNVRGVQAAALNRADEVDGVQVAWLGNAADSVDVQLAMLGNYVSGAVNTQVSFLANIAHIADLQLNVGANIADTVSSQIGLFNLADRAVFQLGMINISESADFPIGVVNVMTEEPVYWTSWVTTSGLVFGGVLHGGKVFRYMYLAAAAPSLSSDPAVFGAGVGFSGHFAFGDAYLDPEIIGMQVAEDASKQSFLLTTRLVFGYQVFERLSLFAGPAMVVLWTTDSDQLGLPPTWASGQDNEGAADRFLWAELHVGFRF